MTSIVTKRGDGGQTDLLYGGRVSKSDLVIETVGTGDEAIAALGLAYASSDDELVRDIVNDLQRYIFTFNARLSTSTEQLSKLSKNFLVEDVLTVDYLDAILDKFEKSVKLPPNFIIPGASVASASLDLARTIVRRFERLVVKMFENGVLEDKKLTACANRLSDILFLLARYQDRDLEQEKLSGLRRNRQPKKSA